VAAASSDGIPADSGAAPQNDEDGILVQRRFDEVWAQHMKERKEGEKRTLHRQRASPTVARSRGGGAGENWCAGAGRKSVRAKGAGKGSYTT
jgi:hypothetical protein